jgi:hypothetical protein
MAERIRRSNGKCDYPVCEGDHYKYEDCRTEALACSQDWADKVTGDVEWRVYAELHLFRESAQTSHRDTGMEFDVHFTGDVSYIVFHNSQGFVWSVPYGSVVEAENAFAEIEREYGEWLGNDD